MSTFLSGLSIILIQIGVGALTGLFYLKLLKKPVIGNLWGALIIGVIGGVLGGFFFGTLTKITYFLTTNVLSVDFIATLAGSFLLLWFASKLAH